MTTLIWLHEDALRLDHPVFARAPEAQVVHIWDDAYLRAREYSLKRLVFLYETLCDLGVAVRPGETREVLRAQTPEALFIPQSPNPFIKQVAADLAAILPVTLVPDEPLVVLETDSVFRRFFAYWKHARATACLPDAGHG